MTIEASLRACLVSADGTIRDALTALEAGQRRITLAVDRDGRLVGVATDGDVRRALLGGAHITDPISPYLTRSFVAVGPGAGRTEVLELMRARSVEAIPVLADLRPVGLHLLLEFLGPQPRSTWAVVMAGGEGRRLRPLTEEVPKPMLKVAGRPILERIVLHLVGHGITRIFLSVNYLGPVIEAHFGDGADLGCRIEYLRESEPLGTAGALGLLPEQPQEPIVVMNGDLVTQADIGAMLEFHRSGSFVATIGIRRYVHAVPFGRVERSGPHVAQLTEKPTMAAEVNTGIYVLDPALVARVKRGVAISMPDLLSGALQRAEGVGAFEIDGDWLDVGQREQLDLARGEA